MPPEGLISFASFDKAEQDCCPALLGAAPASGARRGCAQRDHRFCTRGFRYYNRLATCTPQTDEIHDATDAVLCAV